MPIKVISILLGLGLVFWLCPSLAEAETITLGCSPTATIGESLKTLKPGDTLLVSGACSENLVIPESVQNITLDGQGKATINGPDAKRNTVVVGGRAITIKRFAITGGRSGMAVVRGGSAIIDANTIHCTGNYGLALHEQSSARIVNNTIQNNPRFGILVEEGSFARIGFLLASDPAPSSNVIQNNRGGGIQVRFSSMARIVGNTIGSNSGNGLEVTDGSQAAIDDNAINGNGRDGIVVSGNSGVTIASGPGIFNKPNSTSTNNSGFGIRCEVGGYVAGRIGTLNGNTGVKDFSAGCIDRLKPLVHCFAISLSVIFPLSLTEGEGMGDGVLALESSVLQPPHPLPLPLLGRGVVKGYGGRQDNSETQH